MESELFMVMMPRSRYQQVELLRGRMKQGLIRLSSML